MINTIGPSLHCVFEDAADVEAVIDENKVVCELPDAPPDQDLQLSLGIGGPGHMNTITIAPHTLERVQSSNASSGGTVPSLAVGHYKLLAPAEIVYGQAAPALIELEFSNVLSQPQDTSCLLRAPQLPIVVVTAEIYQGDSHGG